ncbi:fungal-specific transcription factor domain-containing protein [Phialemonium atrogriseum]|uniref:Fungal-specific transcription factor domain-containing protein n=1 Tax=Phialemonium atrogriseum TaxID=1093897 RepID=A0AAJ0C2M2_9PEZI|nr:fungal-specific transcription factor domain-containing protein [Phialemonium atrogriseum]KAK1767572.1 fungal-specific transcription factor domain-containing protein [Phialemonium atrogriseum]
MATFAATRTCESCRERKIRCDGGRPVCENCRRSRRTCVVHSLRLSWPRTGNRRRFVIGPRPKPAHRGEASRESHFLNVSSSHVEEYLSLSHDGTPYMSDRDNYTALGVIPHSPSMIYSTLETVQDGSRSLSYFYRIVANTLPAIEGTNSDFRDLLMKMALSDDSPSSQAVLFSILSLSALHRPASNSKDVISFKACALKALRECASRGNLTLVQTMQHMAAAILLCRIEIGLFTAASTLWCLFVCGANTVLTEAHQSMNLLMLGKDLRLLYRYVHYHNTMSFFSLMHWNRPKSVDKGTKSDFRGKALEFKCPKNYTIPAFKDFVSEEFQLLVDVLDLRSAPEFGNNCHSETHQAMLEDISSRISRTFSRATGELKKILQSNSISSAEVQAQLQKRLFIAATWIYFVRTARQLSGPISTVSSLLSDAFDSDTTGIRHLSVCNLPFIVFILGCETSSEDHRRDILDLIQRTSGLGRDEGISPDQAAVSVQPVSLGVIRTLLEAAWAMEDLHADDGGGRCLDYEQKLHLVLTASEVLPAFA